MYSKLITSLVILISLSVSIDGYTVPSFIQKCHFGDEKCILKTINTMLTKYKDGIPKMGFMRIDPYVVKYLEMSTEGRNGPIYVNMTMVNPTIIGYGSPNGIAKKFRGFVKNVNNTVIDAAIFVPKLIIRGRIHTDGKVLVVPINATGDADIILTNYKIQGKFNARTYMKDGKEYLNFDSAVLTARPERADVNIKSIENSSEIIKKAIIDIIGTYSFDIYKLCQASIDRAFTENALEIFNTVFSRHPYADLFLPDE